MADFPNYDPVWGLAPKVKFKPREASFGDGYSQRGREGLNHKDIAWTAKWIQPEADALVISGFLDDHGGDVSFGWTNPQGEYGLYVCKGYSGPKRVAIDGYEIKAKFERVYDIV